MLAIIRWAKVHCNLFTMFHCSPCNQYCVLALYTNSNIKGLWNSPTLNQFPCLTVNITSWKSNEPWNNRISRENCWWLCNCAVIINFKSIQNEHAKSTILVSFHHKKTQEELNLDGYISLSDQVVAVHPIYNDGCHYCNIVHTRTNKITRI